MEPTAVSTNHFAISKVFEYAAEVVPALSAHLQVQHPNAQQATV